MKRALLLVLIATTAAAEPKNLKVLRDVPPNQIIPIMAFIANSLGVTCAHCHTDKWEADDKPAKETARGMILMMRAINEQHFKGAVTVTCNMCHNGHAKPNGIPLVANAGWNQPPPTASAAKLPSADDVLAHYLRALGPIATVTRRTMRGTATRDNGRVAPVSGLFTLTQEVPDKVSMDSQLSYPPEANRGIGGELLRALKLHDVYKSFAVVGTGVVRGHDVYVVEATPPAGRPERLSFDVTSGLLLRRARQTDTPIGVLPEEIDYDDWQAADGVFVPRTVVWSRADYRVMHKIEEVKQASASTTP